MTGILMDALVRVYADFAGPGEAKRAPGHEPLIEEIARQSFAQFQLAHFSKPGLGDIQYQQTPAITPKITSWYKNSQKSLSESAS